MNIKGRNRNIAKQLYKRTRFKPTFSSNDLRDTNLHKLLGHKNAIGSFFRALQREELAIDVGREPAKQKEAKGRRVLTYVWTSRAPGELG